MVEFKDNACIVPKEVRGPIFWTPQPATEPQEVLFFQGETPHRKYGCGLLHPEWTTSEVPNQTEVANHLSDTIGVDGSEPEAESIDRPGGERDSGGYGDSPDEFEDFEVTSEDSRKPSTMALSVCLEANSESRVRMSLPSSRRFSWQESDEKPVQLNGRYESCQVSSADGSVERPGWRRFPGTGEMSFVEFLCSEFKSGKSQEEVVPMPEGSPLRLVVELFPRETTKPGVWIVTLVLRNVSPRQSGLSAHEQTLYQSHVETTVVLGKFHRYPETTRPFADLDRDEQSLALLYREAATWGIGHGCSAGWDSDRDATPAIIFSDIVPAVQTPSMTPDIMDSDGNPIRMSMRSLANISDQVVGPVWESLDRLANEYGVWITKCQAAMLSLPSDLRAVAGNHLTECSAILDRIRKGIDLLKSNDQVRASFRLANLSMLLQQIGTKMLPPRPLSADPQTGRVKPSGNWKSPWQIYLENSESTSVGHWRAFQLGFLLMSLNGLANGLSIDRETVDLIWFPTGGGKTEAYLGAMSFYMFHQRLARSQPGSGPSPEGTNVIMRYTLRMLTTQQFQRAASMISAMEFLRRNPKLHGLGPIGGGRFALGLWIGRDSSPNTVSDAKARMTQYRKGDLDGNPLVLTECPWCRAGIGRYSGPTPRGSSESAFGAFRTVGIDDVTGLGPMLHCSDPSCEFGGESNSSWLPIDVVDERIFRAPPSLVISTADKFAVLAYRPDAGSLFGRRRTAQGFDQAYTPPGLIVQDELHLISGPLGTMYSLYEGIVEKFCTSSIDGHTVKPKIIASTATIRGAASQVRTLYARNSLALFPSPGLSMGDSFFGKYARDEKGTLLDGRMYLGVLAPEFGSILTAQVRTFATALYAPFTFDEAQRDPWWTLIAFYNSLRELGGAKTLFDSDIRSRLKFMFNREGYVSENRRQLRIVEELTSRVTQAEVVDMMEKLGKRYRNAEKPETIDACLASNIIEVGIDIDRLSLMAVVGQPKTTSTYIQVTGRVGRLWKERPGLVLMLYNPNKNRDRSHFEQFHSYHRRLYERVEPTSATPFASSAIRRGLPGALIAFARQQCSADVREVETYRDAVDTAMNLLKERCEAIQGSSDATRSLVEIERVRDLLMQKWDSNPQLWERFPQVADEEYLMLWPGQYATVTQKNRGVVVPSSLRQVDGNAVLRIQESDN